MAAGQNRQHDHRPWCDECGDGYPGARFRDLVYLINVDKVPQEVTFADAAGMKYVLHPVLASSTAADQRVRAEARYDDAGGTFHVPPRSAVVFVRN